jgi:hypothetical protein
VVLPATPKCPTCGHESEEHEEWSFSPTYNLTAMFREAGFYLRDFDGEPAPEVLAVMAPAVALMEGDPTRFRKHDAPNGWGTYDGIMPSLREFVEALEKYPTAIVRVT